MQQSGKHLGLLLLLSGLLLVGCSSEEGRPDNSSTTAEDPAQRVVDQAMRAHETDRLDNGRVAFDFRDRHYVAERRGGRYQYERIFTDSIGRQVRDILTNEGFRRLVEGEEVDLPAKDSAAYANSVNSVIYFALLPYFLNDAAVRKEYLGEETLRNEPYHKLRVTFRPDGGGKDHEDEFVYWFHRDRHTMDYLAYNYLTDGGGARFREAYHVRRIGGIRFADYINYAPVPDSREVETFGRRLEQDSLEELSRIELKNITFRPFDDPPS